MGEALLVKYGGAASQETIIQQDSCALIVTVLDPLGRPVPANTQVNCNDSGQWYNYETNDNGQVLFRVRTGTCRINVFRYRNMSGYYRPICYADINNYSTTISGCTLNTIKNQNITLRYNNNYSTADSGNVQFLATSTIDALLIGGGSGGNVMSAGCGGGANIGRGIAVDRNTIYRLQIGRGSWNSGGTTSAFGLSANGGSRTAPGGSGSLLGGYPSSAPSYTNSTVSPFNIMTGTGWGGYNSIGEINGYFNITGTNTPFRYRSGEISRSFSSPFQNSMGWVSVYFNHNGSTMNTRMAAFHFGGSSGSITVYNNNINSLTATNMEGYLSNTYNEEAWGIGMGGSITVGNARSKGNDGRVYIRRNT